MQPTTLIAALGLGAFCCLGACQSTTVAAGASPGKRQLAASLGLDPALYSLNELVRIRHRRESDDD
jgi:hypothetical protein